MQRLPSASASAVSAGRRSAPVILCIETPACRILPRQTHRLVHQAGSSRRNSAAARVADDAPSGLPAATAVAATAASFAVSSTPRRPRIQSSLHRRAGFSGLTLEQAGDALGSVGRAKQVWRLLREGANPFVEIAGGLSGEAREKLARIDSSEVFLKAVSSAAVESVTHCDPCPVAPPRMLPLGGGVEESVQEALGEGRGTTKFLLRLHDGRAVEAVLIPQVQDEGNPKGRADSSTTICVSSQVGCAQGCQFCATAAMNLLRNLEPDEVVAQVVQGRRLAKQLQLPNVRNVVFMGMGEPLANLRPVLQAVDALTDSYRMAIGGKKVSLSTVAPSPKRVLALAGLRCQLAWSVHCADDDLRRVLVPSARFTTVELRDAFLEVLLSARQRRGRKLMVAAVLLRGVNDGQLHARQLAELLWPLTNDEYGIKVVLDLIPYNEVDGTGFYRPSPEVVLAFRTEVKQILPCLSIHMRHPRGESAGAACGQLATSVDLPLRAEQLLVPEFV